MSKRLQQKLYQITPLDLHGVKHQDVCKLVEDYILLNQYDCPLQIITGNSNKMKSIVIHALKSHGFNYSDGDYYNRGYIDVFN